jgi:hypothetical protein
MGKPDCPFCAGGKCQKLCKEPGSALSQAMFTKKKSSKPLNSAKKLDKKNLKKLKNGLKKEIVSVKDEKQKKLLKRNLKALKKKLKILKKTSD